MDQGVQPLARAGCSSRYSLASPCPHLDKNKKCSRPYWITCCYGLDLVTLEGKSNIREQTSAVSFILISWRSPGLVPYPCSLALFPSLPLALFPILVPWPCSLSLFPGLVPWPCSLSLFPGLVPWPCSLALFPSLTLALFPILVPWPCSLALFPSLTLALFPILVPWPCSLALFPSLVS